MRRIVESSGLHFALTPDRDLVPESCQLMVAIFDIPRVFGSCVLANPKQSPRPETPLANSKLLNMTARRSRSSRLRPTMSTTIAPPVSGYLLLLHPTDSKVTASSKMHTVPSAESLPQPLYKSGQSSVKAGKTRSPPAQCIEPFRQLDLHTGINFEAELRWIFALGPNSECNSCM